MDAILIDECLSTALVAAAKARGHVATHVVHLGKEGTQDWNLMPLIVEHDFVFVTNNRADFLKLYAELEVHNGLIIILPNVERGEQIRLFGLALDAAERMESTINKLIEVHLDARVEVRDWSRDSHAREHIERPITPES